jgi:CRP-like cAMP-binding protein
MSEHGNLTRVERELSLGPLAGLDSTVLPDWVVDRVTAILEERTFAPGEIIYREGTPSERVYFVRDGSVRLDQSTARSGASSVLDGRFIIGWSDALADRLHTCTTTAVGLTRVESIEVDAMIELLEDSFEITRAAILGAGRDIQVIFERALQAAVPIPEPPPEKTSWRAPSNRLSVVERMLLLMSVGFFRRAAVQTLADLAALAHERSLAEGDLVSERGGKRDELFVVIDGTVQAERSDPDFSVTFGPGMLVGGAASFGAPALSWQTRCTSTTRLLTLRIDALFDEMEEHFDLARAVLSSLADDQDALVALISSKGVALQAPGAR